MTQHDLPTSCPAPSNVMDSVGAEAFVAAMVVCDEACLPKLRAIKGPLSHVALHDVHTS